MISVDSAADAACSFCGKGSADVGRLIAGPGVYICDGCVRVCHEILQQLEAATESQPEDPVMARIAAAQQLALAGERQQARVAFAAIWDEATSATHRTAIAHYMADAQEDPTAELEWDLRALSAADADPEEVRDFYPSLHLNLALDYEKLGQSDEARHHLARAEAVFGRLPEGGYGELIRTGAAELRQRLG